MFKTIVKGKLESDYTDAVFARMGRSIR